MKKKPTPFIRRVAHLSYVLGIASMIVAMFLTIIQQPASAQQGNQCGTGFDDKIEGTGPFTYTTSAGKVISEIIIKAGQNCVSFTSSGSDGCYEVSGIGTQTVTIKRIGDGKTCQEISNVLIYTKVVSTPKVTSIVTKAPTEPPKETETPPPDKTKTPKETKTPCVTPSPEPPGTKTPCVPPTKPPGTKTPPVKTPPVETPPVETPPVETPPVETPPVETPPVETPPVETPPVETPPVETPPVETPPVETPPVETPPVETPPVETPPVETPPVETPTASETPPAAETPEPSESTETPESTLPPPDTARGGQPPLLIPVTGADLPVNLITSDQLQKLFASLGIAFFGLGLAFTGLAKRKETE
jgi:hypothetical protein